MTEKCGLVAVLGAPNAGKSTLVNALVGQKVAIVSAKAQTTRARLMGIALEQTSELRAQIILADTPGIFAPRRRLDRAMVAAAWEGAHEADAILLVVDARKKRRDDLAPILESLKDRRERKLLVLNKVDATAKEPLLVMAEALSAEVGFDEVFFVSALSGDGVAELKRRLAELMPEGPWLYPGDQTADLPVRLLAAEITREKIYLRVHEELPYAAAVETTAFQEHKDGGVRIEQTIYVERESQRPIVLGKGGQTLKWIGQKAREELIEILDRPVHLFLHVKVVENWQEQREFYRDTGLEFDV